jgi:hypothetical protein
LLQVGAWNLFGFYAHSEMIWWVEVEPGVLHRGRMLSNIQCPGSLTFNSPTNGKRRAGTILFAVLLGKDFEHI